MCEVLFKWFVLPVAGLCWNAGHCINLWFTSNQATILQPTNLGHATYIYTCWSATHNSNYIECALFATPYTLCAIGNTYIYGSHCSADRNGPFFSSGKQCTLCHVAIATVLRTCTCTSLLGNCGHTVQALVSRAASTMRHMLSTSTCELAHIHVHVLVNT